MLACAGGEQSEGRDPVCFGVGADTTRLALLGAASRQPPEPRRVHGRVEGYFRNGAPNGVVAVRLRGSLMPRAAALMGLGLPRPVAKALARREDTSDLRTHRDVERSKVCGPRAAGRAASPAT